MDISFENIKNHFELTDALKEELLNRWMKYRDVNDTLRKHLIPISFFGRYFGSKVINYAIGVIEGKNQLGNCPVIGVMLVFFEKKNIPLGDVFMICVNLKNAFIDLALEKEKLDREVLYEICKLIDRNFHGVITEYLWMHYEEVLERSTCPIDYKTNALTVDFSHASAGSSELGRVTTAAEYVKDVDIDRDILEELTEIEEDTLSSLGLTEAISPEAKDEVIDLFTQYAKMLERLVEFQELSYALWMLIDLLKEMNLEERADESTYVIIYVKAIISDLSAWRISVFISQIAQDIHYLDKTLLSSIAQLQILLSPQESGSVDDMEFF